MDVNNINNFKIIDNKIIQTNPKFVVDTNKDNQSELEIINANEIINDNEIINANLNIKLHKDQINKDQINKDQIKGESIESKRITDNKKSIGNEIPKSLTIFELDDNNSSNKEMDFNKIRAFGPTNLPNNPNEIFINPKYL